MGTPRVLILCDRGLFGQAIRRFVEEHTHLQVIAVEPAGDRTLDRVKELCPDLIVIGDEADLPPALLPGLLDLAPQIRIVRLSLEGNMIRVYDGHQLMAHQIQDVVDVLDSLTKASDSSEGEA